MATDSLLTGKTAAGRAKRAPALDGALPKSDEATTAALAVLQGQVERLSAEAAAARQEVATARTEATAKVEAMRAILIEETTTRSQAQAELAGARAESEGLRAQLAVEREARAALSAPLEQAIAAAGAKQPITIPAYEHPAYELEVTGRDVNERAKRIVLKPIKAVA